MHDFAFHFSNFILEKKHPYTLIFEGDCTNSNRRVVKIRYTGADISNDSSVAIPSEVLDILKEQLNKQFGYGMFNKKEVEKSFKDKSSY